MLPKPLTNQKIGQGKKSALKKLIMNQTLIQEEKPKEHN
jgi:hypothetical protein